MLVHKYQSLVNGVLKWINEAQSLINGVRSLINGVPRLVNKVSCPFAPLPLRSPAPLPPVFLDKFFEFQCAKPDRLRLVSASNL